MGRLGRPGELGVSETEKPAKSHGRLAIAASATPRELMRDTPRLQGAWCARVITLFPEAFPGILGLSLTGKALQEGLWALETVDLRPLGIGRHRNVDDNPAGGGAGMVLRADVVAQAFDQASVGTPQDQDGSALMVHAGADDYATDPSGNSGDRVACGVMAEKK